MGTFENSTELESQYDDSAPIKQQQVLSNAEPSDAATQPTEGRSAESPLAVLVDAVGKIEIVPEAELRAENSGTIVFQHSEPPAATGEMQDIPTPEMVLVPAGSFLMGTPWAEAERTGRGWYGQRPLHEVTIQHPFWVGKYPVTLGEYGAFIVGSGNRESRAFQMGEPQHDRYPVVNVSHEDAMAYIEWLSRKTGHAYRLLSEAEWEYAARAGTTTARYWGDTPGRPGIDAHYNTKERACRVGSFYPNAFGLYDMLGNVWEWTADPWHDDYNGAPVDGSAWTTGGNADRWVIRGGSWSHGLEYLRAASRLDHGEGWAGVGFRVARSETTKDSVYPRPAAVPTPPPPAPGTVTRDGPGPEMVMIPAGSFLMGIPEEESQREKWNDSDCRPQHQVLISRPFWLGKYPVTRREYAEFNADTLWDPSWLAEHATQTDLHPAANVSYEDAEAYVAWLTEKTGQTYRMPSEAEWEYAARAGTTTARYWGDDAGEPGVHAHFKSAEGTCPVGLFAPNLFGLYDMLGNIGEWTADAPHAHYENAPEYEAAWSNGRPDLNDVRIIRGGASFVIPRLIRAGVRHAAKSKDRMESTGFRVAKSWISQKSNTESAELTAFDSESSITDDAAACEVREALAVESREVPFFGAKQTIEYLDLCAKGRAHVREGKYDFAIQAFDEAIGLTPAMSDAFLYRGQVCFRMGQHERAIRDYDEAILLNPESATALNSRGEAYFAKGQYKRAIRDFDEAIRLNPSYAVAFSSRGACHFTEGQYDRAIQDCDEAIRLNPKNARAFNNRGNAYSRTGQHDRAIQDYDEAIRLNPNVAMRFNDRGLTYAEKGEHNRAIQDYNEAIRRDSNCADAYCNRGLSYDRIAKRDRALQDYNEAIRLNPDYSIAFNNRGVLYDTVGQHDLAIQDLNEAIRLNRNYAEAFYCRGVVYARKREDDLAIQDYSRAILLNPNDALAFYGRGIVYARLGQHELAIHDFDRAIRLNPDDDLALFNRGFSLRVQGRASQAAADFARARQLNPDLPFPHVG